MSHGPFGLGGATFAPFPACCAVADVALTTAKASAATIIAILILIFMRSCPVGEVRIFEVGELFPPTHAVIPLRTVLLEYVYRSFSKIGPALKAKLAGPEAVQAAMLESDKRMSASNQSHVIVCVRMIAPSLSTV